MHPEPIDSTVLAKRFESCKTIADVERRLHEKVDWDLPSADPGTIIEILSCPKVWMRWPRAIAKGKACVAEVLVESSQFHADLPPRCRLIPPQRLSSGFHSDKYSVSENPEQLEVKIDRENRQQAWRGALPFEVPDGSEILPGDHHWKMHLDFLDFVGRGPACFAIEFSTKIVEDETQRTLVVEGDGVVRIREGEFHSIWVKGAAIVDVGPLGGSTNADSTHVSVQVRVNRSAVDGEAARFPITSQQPLNGLVGDFCGQLNPAGSGTPIVLYACSEGPRPSLLLGRHHETRGAEMLFPSMENTIARRNTLLEILPDGLRVSNFQSESSLGDEAGPRVGRTTADGHRLWHNAQLFKSGRHQLGLGGSDSRNIPAYPVGLRIIPGWRDFTTNGIPAFGQLFRFITARPRKGSRPENNELIDAVILEYRKPPECRETAALHVMLARQLFLDPAGNPVDAEESGRIRAVRLFCCSDLQRGSGANLFMIQRLRAELLVDKQSIDPLGIVPLQAGMTIEIRTSRADSPLIFTWSRGPDTNFDPPRPGCFVPVQNEA
jgi:hypothetical protein